MTGLLVPMRVLRQPAATTGGSARPHWRFREIRAEPRRSRARGAPGDSPEPGPRAPVVRRDRPALWWGRALVAQLDRAPDFESGGREFESLRARHQKPLGEWDNSLLRPLADVTCWPTQVTENGPDRTSLPPHRV